ncbi:MAG: M48 family metallopeptidase [Candidatus Gastranaerophilaceae bacterium]
MKKFCVILLMLFFVVPVNAMTCDETKSGAIRAYVNKIGFTLLNSNKIPYRITFSLNTNSNIANAYSSSRLRNIVIYKGIILIADDEDEIAAVLAHEISHSVDSYEGILRGYFSCYKYLIAPKKYEIKADKRAVDYMVNAGYNPLAIMIIYSKMMAQPRYDWYSSHPLSSKRMMYVYEYIYHKYPAFLVNNKYKDNLYYQNFLLTSESNRKKLQEKIKTNSKKKVKYE